MADMVAWMVTTLLMMLSVLAAASGTSLIRLQRDHEVIPWLASHWFHVMQPFNYFTVGILMTLPLALSLRMYIMLLDAPGPVRIVLVAIPWIMVVAFFLAWCGPSRRTMGISWGDWASMNAGYCWGIIRCPTCAEWHRSYLADKNVDKEK